MSYVVQDDQRGPVTHPLGPDTQGLIMYTHDGYMSAQLMRRNRRAYDQPDTGGGTAEQAAAATAGYLAYSGPYIVDEDTAIVYHDVAVSLMPNWLGTVQLRHGALTGDRLTLITEAPAGGAAVRSTLVWSRATQHKL